MEGQLAHVLEYCWPALVTSIALFGSLLDWLLLAVSLCWRHKATVVSSYDLISPLLPSLAIGLAIIFFQPLRFLALLFDSTQPATTECGRPLLLKCETTHRRVFPKKHAFTYSYLVAGIPVSWKGQAGGMLSAEVPPTPHPLAKLAPRGAKQMTWFQVSPEDHLDRGGANMGLRDKLDAYLRSEVSREQRF